MTTTISATTTTPSVANTISTDSTMNTTAEYFIVTSTEDTDSSDVDSSAAAAHPNGQSDEVNSSPASGTATVAIVVVVLLVLFALGFVFCAKRHNKYCFRQDHLQLYKKDNSADVELAKRLTTKDGNHGASAEDEKPESDQKPNSGGE